MDKKGFNFDISQVADLACLSLTDQEKESFSQQLEDVFTHFEVLGRYADSAPKKNQSVSSPKGLRLNDEAEDRQQEVKSLLKSKRINSENLFVTKGSFNEL